MLRVGAGPEAGGQRQQTSSLVTIAHAVSPRSRHVVGDLEGGRWPVHVDDDHDPGSDALVTTMLASAERSSMSRGSVTVQPSALGAMPFSYAAVISMVAGPG